MRSFLKNSYGVIDLGVVLMIGIAFAALMVVAYIIWTVKEQLLYKGGAAPGSSSWAWGATDAVNTTMNETYWAENATRASIANVTTGFDDAINLILVAITIFVLAIAIGALLMLRGR